MFSTYNYNRICCQHSTLTHRLEDAYLRLEAAIKQELEQEMCVGANGEHSSSIRRQT